MIVEGLPAGAWRSPSNDPGRAGPATAGFRAGAPDAFRADELTLIGGVRHGRTLGSPVAIEIANTEWPKWEQEMSPARATPRSRPDPAPPRPRRPARDAEVRLRGRPGRAGAGLGPRDRRPGGRRARLQSAPGRSSVSDREPRGADGRSRDQVHGPAGPGRPRRRSTSRRCAASIPSAEAAMVAEVKAAAKVRRLPRRGGRGHRLRRPGRAGKPCPLGPQARRPAGSGPDEHPGGQRRSRSAMAPTWPAGGVPRPTTPSCGTRPRRLPSGDATGAVESRAACPTATWSWPGWP